jgi:hypothetical protein
LAVTQGKEGNTRMDVVGSWLVLMILKNQKKKIESREVGKKSNTRWAL